MLEEEEVRYIFDSRPNKCILILAADVSSDLRLSVGLKNLLSRRSSVLKISAQEVQVASADQTRTVLPPPLSAASGATVRSDLFFFLIMVSSIFL